jgi:hypothetical protein
VTSSLPIEVISPFRIAVVVEILVTVGTASEGAIGDVDGVGVTVEVGSGVGDVGVAVGDGDGQPVVVNVFVAP